MKPHCQLLPLARLGRHLRRLRSHPLARCASERFAQLRGRFSFRTLSWLASALLLLLLALPVRAQSPDGGFFGLILESLRQATDEWAVFLLNGEAGSPGAAFVIFGLCLVLQAAYLGYRTLLAAIGQTASFSLAQTLVRQLLILIFLGVTLWLWPSMGAAPMSLFIELGKDASGLDQGLEPDVLAATAYGLMQVFLSPKLFLYTNVVFPNPFFFLYLLFTIATIVALLAIALRAFMLTVEGHLLVTLGPIPFAFSGFRYTAGLADNYIRYAASSGSST